MSIIKQITRRVVVSKRFPAGFFHTFSPFFKDGAANCLVVYAFVKEITDEVYDRLYRSYRVRYDFGITCKAINDITTMVLPCENNDVQSAVLWVLCSLNPSPRPCKDFVTQTKTATFGPIRFDVMDNEQGLIIYNTPDGRSKVALMARDGMVWLNQQSIAELFGTSVPNISMHISNIFRDKELEKNSVIKDYLTTADDGKTYHVMFYSKKNKTYAI